jgi:hypothetical protein
MIAPPLLGDEIAAIHLREEGRYHHLDRRDRLYGWRYDFRKLTMQRLPQDDERLRAH